MNKADKGIPIYSIDKEQNELVVHLGKLRNLYNEYKKLKQENQQLKQKYKMQKDSNKLLCKAITCDDCNCSVCEAHKSNVELKQRIDKAIKYIENNMEYFLSVTGTHTYKLLDILKGEE